MSKELTAGTNIDFDSTSTTLTVNAPPQAALWLPGSSGNYVSCPDAAGLDITGDICITARVALDDWTPGTATVLVAKRASNSTKSYQFYVDTTGVLVFMTSSDGSAEAAQSSTSAVSVSNGAWKWVAVTLDVNNGSSQNETRFWTSDDGVTWTQLGSTVTAAGTVSIFSSTSPLEIGGIHAGTALLLTGRVHAASVRTGIGTDGVVGGTQVAYYDADVARGQPYRDTSANLFTANGSAWALMTV